MSKEEEEWEDGRIGYKTAIRNQMERGICMVHFALKSAFASYMNVRGMKNKTDLIKLFVISISPSFSLQLSQ